MRNLALLCQKESLMITKKSETEFACDECNEPILEGRVVVGGIWKEWSHFCNAKCLHRHLIAESYKEKKQAANIISECFDFIHYEDHYAKYEMVLVRKGK